MFHFLEMFLSHVAVRFYFFIFWFLPHKYQDKSEFLMLLPTVLLNKKENIQCVNIDRYLYGQNLTAAPPRRRLQWSAARSISSMCSKSTITNSNY